MECPNCGQPSEAPLCNLACGHMCCVGCSNPVCKCGVPIQIALPILAQPAGSQLFVGKFKALPHPFSPSTFMTYPAKKKQVVPKHLRKRFKRGGKKQVEEPEEEDLNPDLYKYKVEDKGSKSSDKGAKKAVFLGQLETSENKMPAIAGAVRRSHYTTVMLVRKNNQFSCVYGDALKTLSFRLAVNYKTLDIDQAEAARKRQFKWSGSDKFAKISDRLASKPATGMEAREALLDERPKTDIEARNFAKSTEAAEIPKVKNKNNNNNNNKKEQQEESDESEDEDGEKLDENGKRLENLIKGGKKDQDKGGSNGNGNDSDSSDSFDEGKLDDMSSSSDSDDDGPSAPPPPPTNTAVNKAKRGREEPVESKSKRAKPATISSSAAASSASSSNVNSTAVNEEANNNNNNNNNNNQSVEMQVQSYVRQVLLKQSKVTIRDLAKAVTAEFTKLDKAYIKQLLAPILKNICKYTEVDGVKVLTLNE